MQCPKCKQILDEGVRFCPNDGTPLSETGATLTNPTPTDPPAGTSGSFEIRPAAKELELPVVVGNRYRLLSLRGGGGMAKVYKATDLTLEREVAVKLINPDLRTETEFDSRFQREAKIASQLTDPYIVVVHDFGLDPALGPYLVMEFLEGQSLRERLATSGPLPLKAGLQLAGQLILALMHAHNKGIVHRDIKPDNIFLLNQSGVRLHIRVLDFGIARIYRRDDAGRAETLTSAGAVLGTPRYMSPEQLAGQSVDARSDLFSAALVIHEALTGQLPYVSGKKLVELCPDATPALQDLLDQCLKPNPAERPPTAVEVYLRLQELGKASGILLLPPGAMDRLVAARKANEPTVQYVPDKTESKKVLKRRLLIGMGVLIVLLGLAALAKTFWWTTPSYDGPETLYGIAIEDTEDSIGDKDKVALTRIDNGDPWILRATKDHLGHILRKPDLKLKPGDVAFLKARLNRENTVVVLFHQDRVVAVVTTDRGAVTARGLKMGDSVNKLMRLYPDGFDAHDKVLPDKSHVGIYRYAALGIGFETRGGWITGMTLYPSVKEGKPAQ
jgi:serine/threonine protein kinase